MRQLNPIESAFTRMNAVYPLTLVCVLKLTAGPASETLGSAIEKLQEIHPLLNVVIGEKGGNFHFEKGTGAIRYPLRTVARMAPEQWMSVARQELNTGFDHSSSALMRVTYLAPGFSNGPAEIILSFHHAITDAVSLLPLLKTLLMIAGNPNQKPGRSDFVPDGAFEVAPPFGSLLPVAFKGPKMLFRLLPFMYRQLSAEIAYRIALKSEEDSPVPKSSENGLLTIEFTEQETLRFVKWTRKNQLTLHHFILACMLKIVNRHKYGERKKLLHAVQFANLRPYLVPPVSDLQAGCFAVLMRSNVPVPKRKSIQEIASQMDRQFLNSAKKGDKFLFALLGDMIVKKTIRAHNERLGAAALSYAGPLSLEKEYGNIELEGIHAFISNNCLGAELAAFGKILCGKLSLDLNYLVAETNRAQAVSMAEDLKSMLLQTTL